MKQIALSGIKPTGALHIGNYLGMIKPAFDLIEKYQILISRKIYSLHIEVVIKGKRS